MLNCDEKLSEFRLLLVEDLIWKYWSAGFLEDAGIICSELLETGEDLEIWKFEIKLPEFGIWIAPNQKCEPRRRGIPRPMRRRARTSAAAPAAHESLHGTHCMSIRWMRYYSIVLFHAPWYSPQSFSYTVYTTQRLPFFLIENRLILTSFIEKFILRNFASHVNM